MLDKTMTFSVNEDKEAELKKVKATLSAEFSEFSENF